MTVPGSLLFFVTARCLFTVGLSRFLGDLTSFLGVPAIFLVLTGFLKADTFFTSKVLPILEEHCYECHSHQSGKMKGGLTLDSRSGWATGGDSGPAIVPGKPEASLLITAIRHEDSDYEMPPKKKLSETQIALLTDWVKRGAPDPRIAELPPPIDTQWWSLVPLSAPTPPSDGHPIDAFIRHKLTSTGLAPSPRANRLTLARRLFVDLHGYLPTPEEIADFVQDPTPKAIENLIDQLLASPRYGERWARHWFDVIHFADSHGCEHDVKRPHAWRYRDYVINRLNADVPYARFIREQLAPDVLFPSEPQLKAGLGFIAAGPLELSRAATAPLTFDHLDRDDIVTQTMATFTSTTANCARCHTHKFDPITQEDYYALQAVFAGIGKGDIEYDPTPEVQRTREEMTALLEAAKTRNAEILLDFKYQTVIGEWITARKNQATDWATLTPEVYLSAGGATLTLQGDQSIRADGPLPDQETYTVTGKPGLDKITALRLETLRDDRLPEGGPGRAGNGNLHLSEVALQWFPTNAHTAIPLKISRTSADFDQDGWTSDQAIDQDLKTGWAIFPKVNQSHQIVFELEAPLDTSAGGTLAITLKQLHPPKHLIGRFRLSVTHSPDARILPSDATTALPKDAGQRTHAESLLLASLALRDHALATLATLPPKAIVYGVSSSWSHAKKLPHPQSPKPVHLLLRGDLNKPQHEVGPGSLSALTHAPGRFQLPDAHHESARRAALADWLAHPDNPLTWRSIVNRVWHHHFGRGLCDTPNDFGRMGSQPTHPELLDWLARWFRDEAKGSLKELHKLILTSQTWQQSSLATPGTIDNDNRFLGRMNARRLDAEVFRDSVLRLSGRLDLTMGGPGIEQFRKTAGPQSTPALDYSAFDWNSPAAARRSIYRVVWRGIPDPFMEALDFPDLGILTPKRHHSVSALQSLALLNNPFVLHGSEWISLEIQKTSSALPDQIRRLTHLLWLRPPTDDEQIRLNSFAQAHGLPALTRILLNSNEFLFTR